MATAPVDNHRPNYDRGEHCMRNRRAQRACDLARQLLATAQPFLPVDIPSLHVLDVGCGYGYTSMELAKACAHVVGIEPNSCLYDHAVALTATTGPANIEIRREAVEQLSDKERFDLVVVDNVLEHLSNQPLALANIYRSLKPNGAAIIIVPNKLWPIEVHYRLPFLSYLPLPLANRYLRITRRGHDYTDASYAPTYWGLNSLLRDASGFQFRYVPPADVSLAMMGAQPHYQLGVAALRRFPWLWPVAKVFLVVGVKVQ